MGHTGNADLGMACARSTVRILDVIRETRVLFSLENPLPSGLWRWAPLQKALGRFDQTTVQKIDLEYCPFGSPYVKSTTFVTNVPGMTDALSRRCSCQYPHIPLSGTATILRGDGSKRTAWLASSRST